MHGLHILKSHKIINMKNQFWMTKGHMHLPETAIHTEHKAIFERTDYLSTIDRDIYEHATSLKTAKTCRGFLLKEYNIMFFSFKIICTFFNRVKILLRYFYFIISITLAIKQQGCSNAGMYVVKTRYYGSWYCF